MSRLLLPLFVLSLTVLGFAQAQPRPAAAEPPGWIPEAIQDLGQTASSHSDFTFDHSMLVLASKADQDDDSLRRIIAGVDGVSVHRFRFPNGASYDPEILNAVRREYHAAGYEHLVGAHNKEAGPGETDLWFHFENNAIRKMAFMVVGRDHINFVTISGSISPIDLLHLAGHFGIPPIEGGIKIPQPMASQPPAQQPGY
ncbi:MAG TPA: DUF4252 domain-containing protein [Terriglobales bacterium]|nr:DUF4252 domain-containing protein [Terriglobales bacterium]